MAPYLNTDSVNAFFREFEKEVKADVHVIMIWDQAGFHTSKNVRLPDNVTLIPLPPYSPQLNPIEKLWQYLRKHHWSNRVYADYDALRVAAIDAWQKTCLDKKKVKSVKKGSKVEVPESTAPKEEGKGNPSVSIIVPAYNEEGIIVRTIEEIKRVLESANIDYEIIVVDDGSLDNSKEVLQPYIEGNIIRYIPQKNQGAYRWSFLHGG